MIAQWKFAVCMLACLGVLACSSEPPRTVKAAPPPERAPREAVVEEPVALATEPVHLTLTSMRGAELYVPPWFSAKNGAYDLLIHFHGLGRIQEANIERAKLDVAVVSVNLGAGTTPYGAAFKKRERFDALFAEVQTAIESLDRAKDAKLGRLALSAWSAGYVSIAKVMTNNPDVAEKVDAILLADGFFTAFTNVKKRTIDKASLVPFARFAEAASRDEKLFAITHTTIPTGPFPSVQECVAKLLDMVSIPKEPSSNVGPREMQEIYVVDRGSFHVKGYHGLTARAHVQQAHAMGETLYPYLKARWDAQDAARAEGDATGARGRVTGR